jgi:hypothetical protein
VKEKAIRYAHHIRSIDEQGTDANTGTAYSVTFYKLYMNKLYPCDTEVDYHFQYKLFDNIYISLINIYMHLK